MTIRERINRIRSKIFGTSSQGRKGQNNKQTKWTNIKKIDWSNQNVKLYGHRKGYRGSMTKTNLYNITVIDFDTNVEITPESQNTVKNNFGQYVFERTHTVHRLDDKLIVE